MSIKSIRRPISRTVAFMSVACLLGTAAALASTPASDAHEVIVNYRDLNLATVAGATTLYERISGAARQACGERGYGLYYQRLWEQCFHRAVTGAVETVNNPLLTSVHRRVSHEADVTAMIQKVRSAPGAAK